MGAMRVSQITSCIDVVGLFHRNHVLDFVKINLGGRVLL